MERQQTIQDIKKFMHEKSLSQGRLAKMVGVSSATISNMLNGHWDKVKPEMTLHVMNRIRVESRVVLNTVNFQTVFHACEEAKSRHRMIGIIGYTGSGKTTALRKFYKANENTYYVMSKKTMTAKQFLLEILRQMGVSFNGSAFQIVDRIQLELNKQINPVIVIDEAGKLSPRVFQYIHDLRNETENSCGIVLAGVEYFKTNLEKAVQRNKEGMPEFYDRICAWQTLVPPTKYELRAICQAHGVSDEHIVKPMLVAANFRRLMNQIDNHKHNLRHAEAIETDEIGRESAFA